MHDSAKSPNASGSSKSSGSPEAATGPAPLSGAERQAVDAVLGASRALVAVAARSLAEVGEDVTLAQYRALVVLAIRGPRGLAGLAEALAVGPSTATRMCDRLVRKGLVTRTEDDADRRQVRIACTPAGEQLVAEVTARRRAEIARLLATVPPDDRQALVQALRRFAEAAGEATEEAGSSEWDL